jgi:hypothetical protein
VDVSAILGQMAQLEHHLDGHIRYILGAAESCPFGGNHAWDAVLSHYGGSHDPPLKRLEEAQASGQSRGATLNEVRRAAEGLRTQATGEMDRILAPVPIGAAGMVMAVGGGTGHVALEGRVATLRARLSRIPDEVVAQHAATVCPPKAAVAASVNSVFANATATAKLTPWANVKFDVTKVLECRSCGAPQQVELDFQCRYCRSPMNG